MKGDFSRSTDSPAKHYAGVLMQQGRVQLDADWNELVAIVNRRWQQQAADTFGPCGAPAHDAGFQVGATADGKLTLTPGRLYVGGLVCTLEPAADGGARDHTDLPYSPDAEALDLTGLRSGQSRTDLVYIDAWLRHVSALQDPSLLEPALQGTDTTTRLQTAWQVRVLRDVSAAVDCLSRIPAYEALAAPSGGRLTARTVAGAVSADPCVVAAEGGYAGAENRLYRVEIHDGGDPSGGATLKWSRDNGSVAVAVEQFEPDPKRIRVSRLGRDEYQQFRVGQWVEVLGDTSELNQARGTLTTITQIDAAKRILTLNDDVSAHAGEAHPRVRRWDMSSGAIPVTAAPVGLEHGIEVQLEGRDLRAGDYWTFPARAGAGVGALSQAPPEGVRHHHCRLALVTWRRNADGSFQADVKRCVPTVEPLSERPGADGGCCIQLAGGADLGRRLQEAIDTLDETGGQVCLPAGVHLLERPVVIRNKKQVALCGCGGSTRLVYQPGAADAAITIEDSQAITLSGLRVYARDAAAAVVIDGSRDVQIEGCALVNLPVGEPSPSLVILGETRGATVLRCDLLGGAGVLGGVTDRRSTATIADTSLTSCRVRARYVGVSLPETRGLLVERSSISGLTSLGWQSLEKIARSLGTATAAGLDRLVDEPLRAPADPEPLLPLGLLALAAIDLRVVDNEIRAMTAVQGLALNRATMRDNHLTARIGALLVHGWDVDCARNAIAARNLGVVGTGLTAHWSVRDNHILLGRHGLLLAPSTLGEAMAARAIASLAVGAGALADGLDGPAPGSADPDQVPVPAGKALSASLARQHESYLAAFGTLGPVGHASDVHVTANVIVASHSGVRIERGVLSSRVRIVANRLKGCREVGIGLHGSRAAKAAPGSDGKDHGAHHIRENRVEAGGVGISVESQGTTVTGNDVVVAGASGGPGMKTIQATFAAANVAHFAAADTEAVNARHLRIGFEELTQRLGRGDLSGGEEGKLARLLRGRLAKELDAAGMTEEKDRAVAAAAALGAGDRPRAVAALAEVGGLLVAGLDNAAIRLAASGTAAIGNRLRTAGSGRGGLLIDTPSRAAAAMGGLTSVVIRDNDITGGSGHGIEMRPTIEVLQMTGNTVRSAGGNGIATTGDAASKDAVVAQNQVLGCGRQPAKRFPEVPAAILLKGTRLQILDNTVRGNGGKRPASGIVLVSSRDVTVRGNTVGDNGTADQDPSAGLLLIHVMGRVEVAGNHFADNRNRALEIYPQATSTPVRVTLTGNCFEGHRDGHDHLLVVAGSKETDVVFSHNQIAYESKEAHDCAVFVLGRRVTMLGNIWDEQGAAMPLCLAAQSYTQVGNVAAQAQFDEVEEVEKSAKHNVPAAVSPSGGTGRAMLFLGPSLRARVT